MSIRVRYPKPIWLVVCRDGDISWSVAALCIFHTKREAIAEAEDSDNSCPGCGNEGPHRVVRYVPAVTKEELAAVRR